MIFGPTFEEMLHPDTVPADIRQRALSALKNDPLDPINLFNITWRNADNQINYVILPPELTGVKAKIVVMYGREYPSGSHKVGPAYSILMEKLIFNEIDAKKHRLVWPSTGNFGIGGAWVGGRMGCNSLVVLPEEMSQERFEQIESYGANIIKTPGSESNVKEIYDETWRLRQDPDTRILNQFEEMGNYRFHYHVTGNTAAELVEELHAQGIGNGKVAAFVWAMGSAGTIAAGDRLKQIFPQCKIVGLEPIQCPTMYSNGYGAHEIQGIGDKHVTWVHNALNMDALMCIDDMDCVRGLQFMSEEIGLETLVKEYGADEKIVAKLSNLFGISGICHILGSIKTAKAFELGEEDVVITAAADSLDRYYSVMANLRKEEGALNEARAVARVESIFHGVKTDYVQHATPNIRQRWHNLKYFTWVEQQGKSVQELDDQRDPAWWEAHQNRVAEIDEQMLAHRATTA